MTVSALLLSARNRSGRGGAAVAVLHGLNLVARYADRIRGMCGQKTRLLERPGSGVPVVVPVGPGRRR